MQVSLYAVPIDARFIGIDCIWIGAGGPQCEVTSLEPFNRRARVRPHVFWGKLVHSVFGAAKLQAKDRLYSNQYLISKGALP